MGTEFFFPRGLSFYPEGGISRLLRNVRGRIELVMVARKQTLTKHIKAYGAPYFFLFEDETIVKKMLYPRKVPRIDTELCSGNLRTYPRSLDAVQREVTFREIQLGNRYRREGQGDDNVQCHQVARHGGQHLPQ